jgi:signal transduction histidine kinase
MLAWKISAINNDWIMCFRPEQSKSVKWAGRPQKDVEVVNNKGRLHPRGSFALWIEQVKNTSEPWAEHNIDTAEYLRTKILELRQESIDRDREDHNKTTTARDEFVANIAHDLKTPILGAIKVLEFIRDGHIGGVEKQSSRGNGPSSNDNCSIYRNDESSISSNSSSPKNILGTTSGEIIPETTQLRTIIDQLITSHQQLFERVKSILILYQYSEDTDPLAVETLDLKTLLQEAIDISMPLARAEKVEIELKVLDDASVVGDCDAFRRVFQNLLSNAVKFSEIGGKVQVTLKADDAKVTIEVHDTGRGVPEEDLGFLFKRFWRGASGKKYTAGTGLGLHVCRKIIDAHKGKIWCNSVVGKGTTFTVELPLQQQSD